MICLGNVTLEIEIIKKCFVKLFPNIQVAISSIYTRNFECLWQVLFFNSFYTRSITRGFVGDDLLKCRCHYPLKRHVQVGILFPIVLNLVICFLVLLFIERYWSKERVSQKSRNIFLAECFYEGRPFGSHLLCNLETHCLTILHHRFVPRFVRLRSWMNPSSCFNAPCKTIRSGMACDVDWRISAWQEKRWKRHIREDLVE